MKKENRKKSFWSEGSRTSACGAQPNSDVSKQREAGSMHSGNGSTTRGKIISSRGRHGHGYQWRTDALKQRGGGSTEMSRECYKQIMQQRRMIYSTNPNVVIHDVDDVKEDDDEEVVKFTPSPTNENERQQQHENDQESTKGTGQNNFPSWKKLKSSVHNNIPSWKKLVESKQQEYADIPPFDKYLRDKLKHQLSKDLSSRVTQIFTGDHKIVEGTGHHDRHKMSDNGRFAVLNHRLSKIVVAAEQNYNPEKEKMDQVIGELSKQLIGYYTEEDTTNLDNDDVESIMSIWDMSLVAEEEMGEDDSIKHDDKIFENMKLVLQNVALIEDNVVYMDNERLRVEENLIFEDDGSSYVEYSIQDDEESTYDLVTVQDDNDGSNGTHSAAPSSHRSKMNAVVDKITTSHAQHLIQSRMFSDFVASPSLPPKGGDQQKSSFDLPHLQENNDFSIYEEYTVADDEDSGSEYDTIPSPPPHPTSAKPQSGKLFEHSDDDNHVTILINDQHTLPTESLDSDEEYDSISWDIQNRSPSNSTGSNKKRFEGAISPKNSLSVSPSVLGPKKASESLRNDIWGNDKEAIQTSLEKIRKESELSASHRSNIARFGGLLSITNSMVLNSKHLGIQINGCLALGNMAMESENHVSIIELGAIQAIIRAMKEHLQHNILVLKAACRALYTITKDVSSIRSVAVTECAAIDSCSEEEDLIPDCNIVKTVCACMKTYPNDDVIQEKGFGILGNLCVDHSGRLQELNKESGLATMTMALQRPWENHSDKHEAISTLSILLRSLDCNQ